MLTDIIPSYLYVQYQDEPIPAPVANDTYAMPGIGIAGVAVAGRGPVTAQKSDLQAFVDSYNALAQGYLDDFNSLSLPIYTLQSGAMLDWVALGIYGVNRPSLSAGTSFGPDGVYNTVEYNKTAYSEDIKGGAYTNYVVTDDHFKRILTWNFYKGDGFQFDIPWLKRRIKRFLYGFNGVDFPIGDTYQVSVTKPSANSFAISIPNLDIAPIFAACIAQGVLNVPFQYTFTVSY